MAKKSKIKTEVEVVPSISMTDNLILEYLKKINDRLSALEKTDKKIELTTEVQVKSEAKETYPVPQEYRDLVNQILNQEFGVRCTPRKDNVNLFEFTIVVPEKYSPIPNPYKELLHEDIRSKVLTLAEGINGVRDYTELVFGNFNPEVKALIAADRRA